MKLAKALELYPEIEDSLRKHKFIDYADAVKLGKEALKRIKNARDIGYSVPATLLPGEDKAPYNPAAEAYLHQLKESPLGREPKA